jgi:hypothetical protein
MVPVPVPAPYLDHNKQIFQEKFWNFFLPFYIASCFTRKKFINFNKFIVKCERKFFKMKVIKYIMLYLVPVPEPYLITVPVLTFLQVTNPFPVPVPLVKKLRFLRFRFHNAAWWIRTLEMVRAGLQLSLRMSRQMTPCELILQW